MDSPGFREASLKSEAGRSYAVMFVVGLVMVLVISRELTGDADDRHPRTGLGGVAVLVALQVCELLFVRERRRQGLGIPTWFSAGTVVIETLVPTGVMLMLIELSSMPPWSVLCAPPILAYTLMIGLTTLRLRPSLCILAGAVSSLGYGAVVLYVRHIMGITRPATGLPSAAYVSFPVLLFISGVAAAWVAFEIRGYMEAALGEAETRRRMERIEEDISVARTIQRALLPRGAPEIPGYDIAGWNRPADQTGGDYYDWQALPDGNWIVSLADVSGHGIGPALVTAACRAYVRASSFYDGDLVTLTSRINRLLADDLPEGRFVTMVSVLIDPRGGPLGLLSAGHGPILLWVHGAGSVEVLRPRDVPLAVWRDTNFGPAQAVTLAPGDVLALVTDGFLEWSVPDGRGGREQFGLERLRASLHKHAGLTGAAMVEALAADIGAFAGGEPQLDDLTVVVIKRVGHGCSPPRAGGDDVRQAG
jgi:serine phosphatase RsbU (regulator of sigma subunit)